ncbi:MAG: hypothetical protein KAU16_07570 [Methanophagales archaeon]|nr:hypothetical protein [Methanophagales archaeon]
MSISYPNTHETASDASAGVDNDSNNNRDSDMMLMHANAATSNGDFLCIIKINI